MTAIFNRSITIRPLNLPRLLSPLHPSILVGILLSIVLCQPLHAGITDCNNNGIEDATDIANGTSTDCNTDGVPDDCASGVAFRPYSMSTNSISSYRSATPIDLDGDGDLDLAARYFNFSPNALTVFENYDGEGPSLRGTIFPEFGTTSSFPGTRDMASADIDGDGDHDLVIDFGSSGGIRWLENLDGLGGDWQAHDVSAQIINIVELALIDFDQDGDIDVIAGGEFLDAILLFKNDGAGNFSPPITAINSIPLVDFVLADIDTDGQLDIVLTQTGPAILGWVRFDPISNSFEPFVPISTPYLPFSELVVEAGDVDGDNDNDIIIARRRSGSFSVLENATGTGQFSVQQEFTSIQARANDLKLADLDQDHDLDLIIGSTFTTSPVDPIRWHLNDNGVISTVSESMRYANAPIVRMKLADMNGDGSKDILATTNSSESAVIFFATDHDCDDNGINDACEIADGLAADCDANGIPDVCDSVLADCNGNQTPDWCEFDCDFNGLIEFCEPLIEFTALPIAENLELPYGLDLGDINRDGRQDIVITELNGGAVSWYPLEPSGQFGPKRVIENNVFEPLHVLLIDVDEDGWLDVVFNTFTDGDIYWCRNVPGDDTFEPKVLFSDTESEVIRLEAFDIDGDGDRDVVGSSLQDSIFWHENLAGNGSFGPIRYISNNFPGARPFDFADMDADGDLDIIASSFTDSRIAWFPNLDGVGNFGAPITIEDQLNGAVVTVALDMDEDGDNDIYVSADSNANDGVAPDQFWLKNLDGAGTSWTRRTLYDGDTNVFATTVTDVDQDGMLDIVRGNFSGFSWYSRFNRPSGTWGYVRGLDADLNAPITIKPTDLDGDGDLDIVLTSQFQNTLYAFYQSPDDCDGNGFPDRCQADTDNNSLIDACEPQLGDVNCDGVVDIADVTAFALALVNPAIYAVQFPDCTLDAADVNADQLLNAEDIEGMLTLLTSP